MAQTNIGSSFPLHKLSSDISRNEYNYQSIMNALILWDKTTEDSITFRLTKDTDPFFQDYTIPSKYSIYRELNDEGVIYHEAVNVSAFSSSSQINKSLYGGAWVDDTPWIPSTTDVGDKVTFRITVKNNGGTSWRIYYIPLVVDWESGNYYRYNNFVRYDSVVYKVIDNIANSTTTPDADTAHFEEAELTDTDPQEMADMPSGDGYNINFSSSMVCRVTLTVDVAGFIVKNVGSVASTTNTDIVVKISSRHQANPSIYQRSVDIFKTSNYSDWPNSTQRVWAANSIISPTNEIIPIENRQSYSAIMTFKHTDQENTKTVNFINYDGPDLDQGLCIYLPVDTTDSGGSAQPEDGFTYEFYFRIWPNPSYTNDVTRDHIINKSQIYVYNSPNEDDVAADSGNTPIAKFSMARMTNFYMFAENVSIPDTPVVYRATFIYSLTEGKWITLDYYQLPDHIFMGPIGFINPQNPGNSDINSNVIGTINPNASFVGYETGAFPTFTDVFSNPDLTPYRVNDSDADEFFNRIIDK